MVHAVRRKYSCLNNIVQIFSNEQEDDTKTLQLHSGCVREKYSGLWSEPPSCLPWRWCSDAPCPPPAQYPSLFVGTLGCKCRQWWPATSARQHQSLPHCQHCRVHCPQLTAHRIVLRPPLSSSYHLPCSCYLLNKVRDWKMFAINFRWPGVCWLYLISHPIHCHIAPHTISLH